MAPAQVMGVLNVTPDSFSDAGRWQDLDRAVDRAREMLAQGAAIVDVGGESSRPGATPVPLDEELARVVPVVGRIAPICRSAGARVSVDTRKPEVALEAAAAGATILNDVSASLEHVAASTGMTWIAMHMRGRPATMQDDPEYGDVVAEVSAYLADALSRGRAAGVADVWIDPGIGFGKRFEHNWALLAELDGIVSLGAPVVVGTSRKAFLADQLARSDGTGGAVDVDDRLEGSVVTAVWAASLGAAVVRVHDVAETAQAVVVTGDPTPDRLVDLAEVG